MEVTEEQLPLGAKAAEPIGAEVVTEETTIQAEGDVTLEIDEGSRPATALATQDGGMNPLRLLETAINKGVSIEQLDKLMALHERWEANEARKAFVKAMADFKADPPTITRNKHVSFTSERTGKKTEYDHASLGEVCSAIIAGMGKYGLSHRWETEQAEGKIRVTCVLIHAEGHSERTTLSSSPDDSGGKNSIQAIASAVSYLQRYTLLSATGLAAIDDDDGRGSGGNGADDPPARPRRKSEAEAERAAAERKQAEHAQALAAAPEQPAQCFLIEVSEKTGETRGKPWKLWLIVTDGHESLVTFHESIAKLAKSALENDEAVVFTAEPREKGKPQITSLTVVSTGETAGA